MSVGVVIQAHPRRRGLAEQLATLVAAEAVAYDPDPEAAPSPWRSYRLALRVGLALRPEHDHVLVLQDDAEPVAGLRPLVEEACRMRPHDPIAFFVGGQNPQNAIKVRIALHAAKGWAELDASDWIPLVATAWPRLEALELLEHGRRYRDPVADDMVAGRFLSLRGRSYLAVVPSPVEHGDAPSLLGSTLHRQACAAATNAGDVPLAAW